MSRATITVEDRDDGSIAVAVTLNPPIEPTSDIAELGAARSCALAAAGWIEQTMRDAGEHVAPLSDDEVPS